MKTLHQFLCSRLSVILFVIAALCAFKPSAALGQYNGANIDACGYGDYTGPDGDMIEWFDCLTGDSSGIYGDEDIYLWGDSGFTAGVGARVQLYDKNTLVSDSGDQFAWWAANASAYEVPANIGDSYTLIASLQFCYDSTAGNNYNNCSWSGDFTVDFEQATVVSPSILYPAYQVVSIIYAPPGNESSDGFTNTTTNGTTTTIGTSIQDGNSMTFSAGWGWGSFGESFGTTSTTTNSTAFQESFTDASGTANALSTTDPDAINHNQDLFLIWLTPQVSIVMSGSTPVSYSMGIQPTANGSTPAPDVLHITASTMEANSAGVTTVPATWLNQQYNTATGQYTPGLASICKNLITSEYSAGTCTLNDQCGCTPADFAPILQMDPLLYQNGVTNPINPYPGTMSPLNANISTNCGTLPPPSGANCRYVPVPSGSGSTVQEVVTLAGPQCSTCDNSPNTFTQTENTSTTYTFGTAQGESTGVTLKIGGGIGPSLTIADTWTWTNSQSTGTAIGSGSTLTVTFNSSTVGCGQDIPIYEDTEFHTFVFQQPANNDSCTAVPTFSPFAGTYATAQSVSISYPVTGATIYYTTNGTTPTTSSTVYTGPITVNSTETIRAIATVTGYSNSATGSAAYTIY
jgi:hypothetical protein